MRAAIELAGYTPSESDDFRSATLPRRNSTRSKSIGTSLVEGAVKPGHETGDRREHLANWEEFARYGFNKSHAADYGVIAVQTAYLKANYPAEYMTALLSASAGDTAKVPCMPQMPGAWASPFWPLM